MALELSGTTGVSLVQDGVITDANLPAGSVLQVVESSQSASVSTSADTFVTTGLSASITPVSASSKVLVIAYLNAQTSGADARFLSTIYRGATDLGANGYMHAPSGTHLGNVVMTKLDSPSSAASVTYTVYFKSSAAVGTVLVRGDVATNYIQLLEIAG